MNLDLTPTQLVVALAVVVLVLGVARASARRARAAADAARSSARLLSLGGRVVVGAALLTGAQWLAVTYPGAPWEARLAALALPALVASYTLTKALTITTVDDRRRGGRR